MDTNKIRDLKELAEAATAGEWTCSDKHDGRFWHIQAGSQAIGATHAAGRKSPMAGVFEANARFIAAASPATVLALLAEIERHEAWRTAFLAERDAQMRQRDQLRAENDGLRKALLEASEEVATWGAYASEYFQEKHDLAGCVAKLHAAAMAKEASHD
ncbi:ead/Ea22-like family protein [Pseudomonas putida]|uniref:ead/Ea22-like family protein n=1 Tax=Pseudomonas putida TaxID=303 RepID=UPI00384E3978